MSAAEGHAAEGHAAAGRWEPVPDALYATTTARCDLCGKMIVGRLWRARHGERRLSFCDRRCQRTWLEYWLPRYGGADAGAARTSAAPAPSRDDSQHRSLG